MTWRGRCEVLAESRYATPEARNSKSLLTASTSSAPAVLLDLDVDIVALHDDRIGPGGDHGGEAGHLAGRQVEARPVRRALDVEAPQLALAQRVLLVRAGVGDGVEA